MVNQGISIDCITEKEIKEGMRYTEYKRTINDNGYKSMIKYNTIHGYIDINDWTDIYMLPRLCTVSNVVRDFQFKILHRFLPTQSLLLKMQKIDSPLCLYCNSSEGNLEHEMFDCLVIKNFWYEVMEAWNNLRNHSIVLDLRIVTLGYFCNSDSKYEHIALNYLLLLGKLYVFHQKLKACALSLIEFKHFLATNVTNSASENSDPTYSIVQEFVSQEDN